MLDKDVAHARVEACTEHVEYYSQAEAALASMLYPNGVPDRMWLYCHRKVRFVPHIRHVIQGTWIALLR